VVEANEERKKKIDKTKMGSMTKSEGRRERKEKEVCV
jgi:hypothetical protein